MSRAYTQEEVRDIVLSQFHFIARYWAKVEGQTDLEKIEGALFSALNTLDGTGNPFVNFDLILRPHPDDKAYHIENGDNYFEDGMIINDDVYLHDLFYKEV